jgi:hypothetical protein
MSADSRSVHTDALETLGSIIGASEARDAIHLAVEPVVAAESLWRGQDVGLLPDGKASSKAGKMLGIVDPFLKAPVKAGDRFWLVVYPRQITSLRHVWAHPDFARTPDLPDAKPATDAEVSKAWIANFAASINQTVNRLMGAAEEWLQDEEYTYDNSESYKDQWDKFPEFWTHYAIVTGKEVPADKRHSFFTCSC